MSENKIKVTASTSKPTRVSVSTSNSQGAVSFSQDTSAYNAKIAEQWATSENLVLGQDYSSKYYANSAKVVLKTHKVTLIQLEKLTLTLFLMLTTILQK